MSTFERIKEIAKKRGLTLAQLNDKAGLGTNSIYHWKNKQPSAENLNKVAKVLDVSSDYLISGEEGTPNNKTADLADDDVLFTYKGKPLSDEDKELINRLMNGKE